MDLHSIDTLVIQPYETEIVRTGISLNIPLGYEGQIRSRSGLAANYQIAVLNAPGTIDSGYKGEVKVILINHSLRRFHVNQGDRIAQLVFAPIVVLDRDGSIIQRGDRGLGSTGVGNNA